MYFIDQNDPAFRFEELARYVFDSRKRQNPWGYAAQELYDTVQEVDLRGKRILSTVINVLIYKNRENSNVRQLVDIVESVWSAQSQHDVIGIINRTISFIENNNK